MPFSLGQIFGGWRRKENRSRPAVGRAGDENSRRGRAPERALASEGRVKEFSEPVRPTASTAKNKSETAWNVIRSPHISEKATMLGEGRYILKVATSASKPDVKLAIKERYGVSVDSVRMINSPAKVRRRGRFVGEKAGFKKAIIKLKEGNVINEF